jgi:hypothetical protein
MRTRVACTRRKILLAGELVRDGAALRHLEGVHASSKGKMVVEAKNRQATSRAILVGGRQQKPLSDRGRRILGGEAQGASGSYHQDQSESEAVHRE